MASAIVTRNPDLPGPQKHRRFSPLTLRIVLFNAIALVFLLGGVLYVRSNSAGLVDERIRGIQEQASIVAGTLAEYTTDAQSRSIEIDDAEPLLRQLISPTRLRARVYGTDGRLEIDTRELLARNVVQTAELPPLDFWGQTKEELDRLYDGVMGIRPFAKLAPYLEGGRNGKIYSEVDAALRGETASAERVDEQKRLVLSVATPVERFRAIYGVVLLSTEGGDIDGILRQERASLIEVFLVALAVMIGSSLFLAGTIARPVQKLAAAAERVRKGRAGREQMPLPERNDEIGELSESLSAMTQALYDRIDAIESFAADVAHELKNPLTSMKSAIEMFSRAKDDAGRARLMEIVRNDVKRIDRLITDISDASRLDAELSREAREPVEIAHLLETIVEVYGLTGLPRGVTLTLALDLPPDATVIGRDERIGQIFRNLIDNALSFSPDNAVVRIAAHAARGTAHITVEDEGEGIPPENLETIFNRFYTERPAEHGFGKNSGLGLSIARQIAAGLGGRIRAENRDSGGARFVVELPLAAAP
ncbi:MAG: stimulus-sensing domain-containing protein [Rhizomicrobium sp.]|jgi:two-component system sensor histidine kinase ChvG